MVMRLFNLSLNNVHVKSCTCIYYDMFLAYFLNAQDEIEEDCPFKFSSAMGLNLLRMNCKMSQIMLRDVRNTNIINSVTLKLCW